MELITSLLNRSEQGSDLFVQTIYLMHEPVTIAGFASMIDLQQSVSLLQQHARHAISPERSFYSFISEIGERLDPLDDRTVMHAMLQGQLTVLLPTSEEYFCLIPSPKTLSRSVESPTTENVLRGSSSAFIEDMARISAC